VTRITQAPLPCPYADNEMCINTSTPRCNLMGAAAESEISKRFEAPSRRRAQFLRGSEPRASDGTRSDDLSNLVYRQVYVA
jgi:hypothetical protein